MYPYVFLLIYILLFNFNSFNYFQDVKASKNFSEEAAQMYERAISGPLMKNQLLYFAFADFEESRLKYSEVHKIYQRYIDIKDIDPTLVSIIIIII